MLSTSQLFLPKAKHKYNFIYKKRERQRVRTFDWGDLLYEKWGVKTTKARVEARQGGIKLVYGYTYEQCPLLSAAKLPSCSFLCKLSF